MSSTDQEIMEATYRVLIDGGYSELSIRRIAAEFEGSQSLIYYHYDDKEDLLAGFLDFLLDGFERELAGIETDDPAERLAELVALIVPQRDDPDSLPFQQALEEIRTQTPYHDRYHDSFAELDDRLQSELERTIQRGIDDDVFAGIDAAASAERLHLLLYGVVCRHVPMRDWDGIDGGLATIEAEIESWRE